MPPGRKPNPQIALRNQEIARIRLAGGDSLEGIGAKYEISRERVRQICNEVWRKQLIANGANSIQVAVELEKLHDQANRNYRLNKSATSYLAADQQREAIMFMYVSGSTASSIAKSLEISVTAVQSLIEEHTTDEIIAARSNVRHGSAKGSSSVQRSDRIWTEERCVEALAEVARLNGGLLPSAAAYEIMAKGREDLPSLPTVRLRLGRWTAIRVAVRNYTNQTK